MTQKLTKQAPAGTEEMGCLGLVVRLTWLMAGNMALVILAFLIGQRGSFSAFDVAFWLVAAGLVVARYFDVTRLKGQTKDGEPATLAHWRRYVVYLALAALAMWAAAHAIGILAK